MTLPSTPTIPGLNVSAIREDFPILQRVVHGKPLVYLDSTATSQKPEVVIQALDEYYRKYNANIHRGIYSIAEEATARYEEARKKAQRFVHARSWREIVFTRNSTESLNLIAYSWGRANIREGDEIVTSVLEHHSNIIPWQLLAAEKGATLKYITVDEEARPRLDRLDETITPKTRLVAITMVSNVAGTIVPLEPIIQRAHEVGAIVVVDAAQGVPHMPVDVRALEADFLVFSGHKMLGPFAGVLYGKRELLEAMPPFMGGGEMIREVFLDHSTWADLPYKFEAGTPAIPEAIGIGVAIDYLNALGMENVRAHEKQIVSYALDRLATIPGLRIVGPKNADERGGVIAFDLDGVHPHDVATILDSEGICVRAGFHCAQPLHEQFGLAATARASFYVYNSADEVDKLVETLKKVRALFK